MIAMHSVMPKARTSPKRCLSATAPPTMMVTPNSATTLGANVVHESFHVEPQLAEDGGEKRRVASHVVVLETLPLTLSQRHLALFPLVGEVAHGSRWEHEGGHATY